jgi:hypothetical protein
MHVADEMVNAVNAFSDLQDSRHDGYPISARPDRKVIHCDREDGGPILSHACSQCRNLTIAKVIHV